ncbi:MAG: hypothetical protein Phog2KO_22130 [Phototrophicaceae bacterium]
MAEYPKPTPEGFELSKNEQLFERVSNLRFAELAFNPNTRIHEVKIDTNNYGEFLFVTVSRAKGNKRDVLTFWGLGLHEHRDRLIQDEWFYYKAHPFSEKTKKTISTDEAQELIRQRQNEIKDSKQQEQSSMGALFEMLADLTDDDGALSELEDLRALGFLLDDEE